MNSACSSQILCSWELAQYKLVCLQVMFFVGVQLDITAPPTPKAAPSTQQQSQSRFAPTVGSAVADRQLAATADSRESDTAQQPAMLPSPAASLQAQSQVHSAAMWHMCACSTSNIISRKGGAGAKVISLGKNLAYRQSLEPWWQWLGTSAESDAKVCNTSVKCRSCHKEMCMV